jgi:hypothetical protein
MFALIIAAVLYLTLFYALGRYTAKYAAQRGRSKALWFLLGAVSYPIPYLVLALLPPIRKDNGSLTPPAANCGPDSVSPTSQTETRPQQDTTGYTRGRLTPITA